MSEAEAEVKAQTAAAEEEPKVEAGTAEKETEAEAAAPAVEEVTQSLEEILALGQGLDDQDYKAELDILQNDPNSNLYSAVTFEELNL